MQHLNEIFVAFAQNEVFTVFFRLLYALGVLIFFIKGEVSVSKFVQTFSNLEQRWSLGANNKPVANPELSDCQAEIQSHKDDCLSSFLDRFLPEIRSQQPLADLDDTDYEILHEISYGSRADRILGAFENVQKLREKYNVPEHFTNDELLEYLEAAKLENAKKLVNQEGGVPNEKTQNVEESEQT